MEAECLGLTCVLKNGVPASHVDAIRANYRAERTVVVSEGFEAGISKMMYHFEIEDTAINRQRAEPTIFEGRAAALLEIDESHELVDKTLSEFTGGGRPAKPATQIPAVEVAAPVVDITPFIPSEVEAPLPDPVLEIPKLVTLDLTPGPAEAGKAVGTSKSGAQRVVAVSDFEQECEKLIANMGDGWEPATGRDAMALVRMSKSVLIEHGIEHSGQIEQCHIGQLWQHFNHIPTDWGRSSRMRVMTAPEPRAEGDRLKGLAEYSGTKPKWAGGWGPVSFPHDGAIRLLLMRLGVDLAFTFHCLRYRLSAQQCVGLSGIFDTPHLDRLSVLSTLPLDP